MTHAEPLGDTLSPSEGGDDLVGGHVGEGKHNDDDGQALFVYRQGSETQTGCDLPASLPEPNAPEDFVASTGKKPKSSELRTLMARRLRAARTAFDEQASSVARALGVSKQTLHGYETGRTFPDELFLVRFNALTGCPLDWIFLGRITAEMPPARGERGQNSSSAD